jgi:hypothetical protein
MMQTWAAPGALLLVALVAVFICLRPTWIARFFCRHDFTYTCMSGGIHQCRCGAIVYHCTHVVKR